MGGIPYPNPNAVFAVRWARLIGYDDRVGRRRRRWENPPYLKNQLTEIEGGRKIGHGSFAVINSAKLEAHVPVMIRVIERGSPPQLARNSSWPRPSAQRNKQECWAQLVPANNANWDVKGVMG